MAKLPIAFRHFITITKHKYYVGRYCFICGLYWRGIKHDISKYSPTEFKESIKYYTSINSPIDNCKKANGGVSFAWMHHKGRNDHHREYWVDNVDKGTIDNINMPFECAVEMICDHLGAGKAYHGNNFTYIDEFKWYNNLLDKEIKTPHPHIRLFEYEVLLRLALMEYSANKNREAEFNPYENGTRLFVLCNPTKILNKKNLRKIYDATATKESLNILDKRRKDYAWLYM